MGNSSRSDAVSVGEGVKTRLSQKTIVLGVLSLVLTIILCLAAIYYKDYLISAKYVAQYGLLGMLIVAFLGGSLLSMIAIPVPYWLLVFTLPSVLAPKMGIGAPIVVGITSGLGACLGQLLTFMVGYGSRDLSQQLAFTFNKHLYVKAVEWAQRRGSLAVFLMSAIVNPLHLPMTLAMASLRFPAWKFILYSLLGNIVKSSFIAFCGYFGLTSLFKVLGI
ncbi:MAG: VTT domain-containing protein [Chloroflexi bacterium]|nr:VTT domain-containing protein [Chloroflexota bacterium]